MIGAGQGALSLDVPRDRNGEFEPRIIPKGRTRLPMFNDGEYWMLHCKYPVS